MHRNVARAFRKLREQSDLALLYLASLFEKVCGKPETKEKREDIEL